MGLYRRSYKCTECGRVVNLINRQSEKIKEVCSVCGELTDHKLIKGGEDYERNLPNADS